MRYTLSFLQLQRRRMNFAAPTKLCFEPNWTIVRGDKSPPTFFYFIPPCCYTPKRPYIGTVRLAQLFPMEVFAGIDYATLWLLSRNCSTQCIQRQGFWSCPWREPRVGRSRMARAVPNYPDPSVKGFAYFRVFKSVASSYSLVKWFEITLP